MSLFANEAVVAEDFSPHAKAAVYQGDCLEFMSRLPDGCCQLIVTSPPYNIGKEYEQPQTLRRYVDLQTQVIDQCIAKLAPEGSICWQVGNHAVGPQEILPLDIVLHEVFARHGLRLRNRIVWHFEHGLHCSKRFSGRYDVLYWFTKGDS